MVSHMMPHVHLSYYIFVTVARDRETLSLYTSRQL
jgi:hypothetical protein